MYNPFLSSRNYDTETAVMLEKATVMDIGKAVAYTNGTQVYLNTPDNLCLLLPDYNDGMLKWLLWHERIHNELKHHNRFYKYLASLDDAKIADEFHVTKDEVNIIMDILVHDWMSEKFPDLVETAQKNLAQFRNRNSLKYTFKTYTLEEMLDEYAKHKKSDDTEEGSGKSGGSGEPTSSEDQPQEGEDTSAKKTHSKDGKKSPKSKPTKTKPGGKKGEDTPPEVNTSTSTTDPDTDKEEEDAHDKTDWSQLDNIDSEEFIDRAKTFELDQTAKRLKQRKLNLARITQTINGLATNTKIRTYKVPNYAQLGQHTILKGNKTGRASLFLCFDASGSMSGEMKLFKEIIQQAIPQALNTPTLWFAGCRNSSTLRDPDGKSYDYYKGTFKDFLPVIADNGWNDDGDRTIELCWRAEQLGYSPIGITDGGGRISWSVPKLKELKRTILVGDSRYWLKEVQRINPRVQILCTDDDE